MAGHAACVAWSGALVGLVLAHSGANIGDGPGWWVVVYCSGREAVPLAPDHVR